MWIRNTYFIHYTFTFLNYQVALIPQDGEVD